MLFDSHAHLDDNKYSADRSEVIAALLEQGTAFVMNVASDIPSSYQCIKLAEKYPFIYASVGVHPSETGDMCENDMEILKKLLRHERVKAIERKLVMPQLEKQAVFARLNQVIRAEG